MMKGNEAQKRQRDSFLMAITVFSMLVSMGFPGQYTRFFGPLSTMCEYGAFALQFVAMFIGSGDDAMTFRLLDMRQQYWSLYLLIFVFFSTSMAVTIDTKEQFISCFRLTVTILFAIWIANRYSANEILELMYRAQFIFVAFDLLYLLIGGSSAFTNENGTRNFCGFLTTKNTAAGELAWGVMVQIMLTKAKRRAHESVSQIFVLVLAVQLVLLVMCNARGALFCAALPMIYLFIRWHNEGRHDLRLPLGVIYIVGSVSFLIVALTVLPFFEPVFNAFGKDATLTGRVPMWRQVITVMSGHNTFLGYGFAMFWRNKSAMALLHTAFNSNSFMGNLTSGTHNTILELWANDGLFGVASYFIAILSAMGQIKRFEPARYDLCAAWLLRYMIYGLTERAFTSPYTYNPLFLFIVLAAGCNKPQPERARRRGTWGDAGSSSEAEAPPKAQAV